MRRIRVIPVLGIENRKMVKTIQYKKPKYLGDPINAIKIFNEKEVDEICILDIRASINNKEPDYDHICEMAGEAFMPVAYGGGVATFEQAKKVFGCGVEKVILNSAQIINPAVFSQIADTYGEQSVVLSLDVVKNWRGKWVTKWMSGSKKGEKLEDFLNTINKLPVGEVLLHNIEREGTFKGIDLALVHQVAAQTNVPVVPIGGANSLQNMLEAVKNGASAVAAASYFSFKNNNTNSILINYPSQMELNNNNIFEILS